MYGATAIWTTSDASVITAEGIVTRPASGQPDATATLTVDVYTGIFLLFSRDIEVTVMAEVPVPSNTLFFSEYAEADGGNCKYVEIYNPGDVPADLSLYTIIKGGNGKLFADSSDILALTGLLQPGEVLVIGNAGCVTATDQSQDPLVSNPLFPIIGINWLESTVVGYINGDDALGLFWNGILVDAIGQEGVDPGSNWPVGFENLTDGTTANTILIRVPFTVTGEADWTVGAMEWMVVTDNRDYSSVGWHDSAAFPADPS